MAVWLPCLGQTLAPESDPIPTLASPPSTPEPPAVLRAGELGALNRQVAAALRDAERHFQMGKFAMQEGKAEEARAEFNRAVEILLDLPEDVEDRPWAERKFEELIRQIHRYDVERLGSGEGQEEPVFVKSPLTEILEMTFPVDPRMRDKALAMVRASSSQLPLVVNDAVTSYIAYFTSERGRRTFINGAKRGDRYRAMIYRIFDEEGIPRELIHLAQAESGFIPRAVSVKAATGMWQFVRFRGLEYGLGQSKFHDDRLDPEKATRAAARHLRDLYHQLGDWYLAMAGYNCGPGCVERSVQRTGYADFWQLRERNVLPRETQNYVPAILAMAIVAKNPAAYGIRIEDGDKPLEFDVVKITTNTNLALAADAADLPMSDVRELNQSLIRNIAPSGYELKVPKGKGTQVMAALELVPPERRANWRLHRVSEGDTLQSIAKRYSTAAGSILAANAKPDASAIEEVAAGEVLLIPAVFKDSATKSPARGKSVRPRSARSGATAQKAGIASVRKPAPAASSKPKAPVSKPGRARR
jgi:membrane-bound lytic murein transglycosylase D